MKGEDPSLGSHHPKGHLVNYVKLVARKKAMITAASVIVGNTTIVDLNTSSREMSRGYCHRGLLASEVKISYHLCNCCQKPESEHKFKQCKNCKTVRDCSDQYLKTNWTYHKKICRAIKNLSFRVKSQNVEKRLGDGEDDNVYVSHITPKQQACVTKLVG